MDKNESQSPCRCKAPTCGCNAAPANPCHTEAKCVGGNCGPHGLRPDGYNYEPGNYLNRCCGGNPTQIRKAGNPSNELWNSHSTDLSPENCIIRSHSSS